MELIPNWDNQNQRAKSFQMRYSLSKLKNQTLTLNKVLNLYMASLCNGLNPHYQTMVGMADRTKNS